MLDPDWMHRVPDCSTDALTMITQLLSASTKREHWLYREAELDDLWRHCQMEREGARRSHMDAALVNAYEQVGEAIFEAHDLASVGQLDAAAARLKDASRQLERAWTKNSNLPPKFRATD